MIEFIRAVPGGIANIENTVMRVSSTRKMSDFLKSMFENKSLVVSEEMVTAGIYDHVLITNGTGGMSYFNPDYIDFVKSLKPVELYLSNVPAPGVVWHGGYLFAKCSKKITKFGFSVCRDIWYVVSPIKYDTVEITSNMNEVLVQGCKTEVYSP